MPTSLLWTDAFPETEIVAVVTDAVGATLSIVIVVVAVAALVGPSNALPVTEFALSLGCIVPSEQFEVVTVYVVPDPLTENVHPVASVAVSGFSKSSAAKPVTLWEKTRLYEAFESLRGDVVLLEKVLTVGPEELPTYPAKRI